MIHNSGPEYTLEGMLSIIQKWKVTWFGLGDDDYSEGYLLVDFLDQHRLFNNRQWQAHVFLPESKEDRIEYMKKFRNIVKNRWLNDIADNYVDVISE